MNISVNNSTINRQALINNSERKVLLIGPGATSNKAREIILPANEQEVLSLYGDSDLANCYTLIKTFDVSNVYLCNCFSHSDYIRIVDKIMHYDFDFIVPIGIYFRDTFYNPLDDEDQYYIEYMLKQLAVVHSLSTIVMTERHASLYEDFDHYTAEMRQVENAFMEKYNFQTSEFLEQYGNNLLFVYNNLKEVSFANVVLAGLFATRKSSNYLPSLIMSEAIYDLNSIDMLGLRAMYFQNNIYANNVTVENPFNFKKTQDIYSNALIDDVIKRTIKNINIDHYKGKLYNQYTALQIETSINKSLKDLKGVLFKEYTINKIGFKKTGPTSGCVVIDYSIVPYGTLETINVIMGV